MRWKGYINHEKLDGIGSIRFDEDAARVSLFLKCPIPALFVYFRPFLVTFSVIQIENSVDGVLGI